MSAQIRGQISPVICIQDEYRGQGWKGPADHSPRHLQDKHRAQGAHHDIQNRRRAHSVNQSVVVNYDVCTGDDASTRERSIQKSPKRAPVAAISAGPGLKEAQCERKQKEDSAFLERWKRKRVDLNEDVERKACGQDADRVAANGFEA